MRDNEAQKLKEGMEILHNAYGRCKIKKFEWDTEGNVWGIYLKPLRWWGELRVSIELAIPKGSAFLEANFERLRLPQKFSYDR